MHNTSGLVKRPYYIDFVDSQTVVVIITVKKEVCTVSERTSRHMYVHSLRPPPLIS